DQMVTLLEEPLRKKIDELGIAGHWIARADKAYGELRPAIEAADAERLAASYLRFRELVGAELQLLAQGKDALGTWAETRQSDKTFEEEVLPDLVLPTFAESVHAVNNWVLTLTTPQAAPLF